ncbi:MAG: DUF2807 domain-containing protein [Saprospiraceae bacterium]|nr:DUF2807 domain-containing protein [Saprospiraceae bacterium]
MNKVIHINLGGVPFVIDEEAYEILNKYLASLHAYFKNRNGYLEIVGDIEARIAEILKENSANAASIISTKDVEHVISIMGKPKDFETDPDLQFDDYQDEKEQKSNSNESHYGQKRLFRDSNDALVGGVCSGISAYLGIEDPLWVRLFVVFATFLSFGTVVFAYLILLVLIPKASNASERLSMKGKPVNIHNISDIIQESAERFSSTVNEIGRDFKNGNTGKYLTDEDSIKRFLIQIVETAGKALSYTISLLKKVVFPIIYFFSFVLLFVLAVIWIASVFGISIASVFSPWLIPGYNILPYLLILSVTILIGVPILSLILMIVKGLYNRQLPKMWNLWMWIVWMINFVFFTSTSVWIAKQFNSTATITQKVPLDVKNSDTLVVAFAQASEKVGVSLGDMVIKDNLLYDYDVNIDIEKSSDDKFYLVQNNFSRGETKQEAGELAKLIQLKSTFSGNNILLPSEFVLAKNNKWRGQHSTLKLLVPEGKFVKFNKNDDDYYGVNIKTIDDLTPDDVDASTQIWQMTKDGLNYTQRDANLSFENGKATKNFPYKDFDEIVVKGNMNVIIEEGDEFSVRLSTWKDNIENFKTDQNGKSISISIDDDDNNGSANLYIKLPNLKKVMLYHILDSTIQGFDQENMEITNISMAELKVYANVKNLKLLLEDDGVTTITGKGDILEAKVNNDAELQAKGYEVNTANVSVFNSSNAEINANKTVKKQIDESSNIEIIGDPKMD